MSLCFLAAAFWAHVLQMLQLSQIHIKATQKQRDECVAVIDACSGVQNILNCLQSPSGRSLSWRRKLAMQELYRLPNTETPYGTICHTSSVQGNNGDLEIYHVNPFALFHYATETYSEFFHLLTKVMGSSPHGLIDFVYFLHKAKPGSERRPDDARAAQCMYWTVLQFPAWFKSRRNGWIPFAYVTVTGQKQVNLKDTVLVRWLIRTFDSNEAQLAFTKGFGVPGPGGAVLTVRASGQLMMQDWEQHVKVFNLKGYNASMPCGVCKNVMGRCPYFEHEYLVHLHSHEYGKFDKHTHETFQELADRIKDIADNGGAAELKVEEQSVGIKYDPDGVLWDTEVCQKLRPPLCHYPDWMHIWCASGGLAQYELNGLVLLLVSHGLELLLLDAWVEKVRMPKGLTRLPKNYFKQRIVHTEGRHIRAFASEVLSAVTLLGFFLDVVVKGDASPDLSLSLQCFDLLRIILAILQRGDPKNIPTLQTAMQAHHELYLKLYHPIPKIHMQVHVVDFWLLWGYLLSCFAPERHHKIMKRTMSFSYNRSHKSALAYDVRTWLRNLGLKEIYMPEHFVGRVHLANYKVTLPSGQDLIFSEWSGGLNTESGLLCKGDMVQYIYNSVVSIGFVQAFASTPQPNQIFIAAIQPCRHSSAQTWVIDHGYIHVVDVDLISSVPYFTMESGELAPLLHAES